MVRTKKFLITMLITALMASVMFFVANIGNTFAAPQDVIRQNPNALELELDIVNGKLQATTTANSAYEYQYWIKTKVQTDLSDNLANEQFTWQMVRGFNGDHVANLTVSEDNKENGKYHVIVRVKEGATLIDDIYGSYAAAGISEVKVEDKAVHGDMIISRNSTVKVEIISHSANISKYALYYGDDKSTTLSSAESGVFNVPMNFQTGYHIFRAEIETTGGEKDSQYFQVYVYDEYVAEERPVIASFTPTAQVGSVATFTMEVEYADGTPILYADRNNFNYSLVSGGITATPDIIQVGDYFKVEFDVDYGGYHGIYQTTATVSRGGINGINGADDKVIMYYDGYAREATLTQTASQTSVTLPIPPSTNYTSITIGATGSITGAENDLLYAFYREDASGWVLIRDYSTDTSFTWTPTKAGTYNIQARIKEYNEQNKGSYEKTASVIYTVDSVSLEEEKLSVNIWDYETNTQVTSLVAGKPYKLEAYYNGTEEILYMFTLWSKDLGTIYLNKYSISPYLMFIPAKADSYKITARAISLNSFGYKDISHSRTINTVLPRTIIWDDSQTVYYSDNVTGFYELDNLSAALSRGTGIIEYQVYDAEQNAVSIITVEGTLGFEYSLSGAEAAYTIVMSDSDGIADDQTATVYIRLQREDNIIADFEYGEDLTKFSSNTGTISLAEDPVDSSNTVLKYVCSTQYSSVSFTNRLFFPDIPVGYKMSYDIKFELGDTSIPGNLYDYMATFTRGMEPQVEYVAWAPEYSDWYTITTPTAVGTHGYFYVYIPYNRNNNMPDVDMTEIFVYIDNVKIIPPEITYDNEALLVTTDSTSGFYALNDLNPQLSYGTGEIQYAVYDNEDTAVTITTSEGVLGFYYDFTGDETIYTVVMTDLSGKAAPVTVSIYIVLVEQPRDPDIIADFELAADLEKFSMYNAINGASPSGTLSIVQDPLDSTNNVLKYVANTQYSSVLFTNRLFFDFSLTGKKLSYDIRFTIGDNTLTGAWYDYFAVFTRGMPEGTEYNAHTPHNSDWYTITTGTIAEHAYFYLWIQYNRFSREEYAGIDMTQITVYIDNVKIIP